jgi:cytochrome oxidase assembly protein ShyY1
VTTTSFWRSGRWVPIAVFVVVMAVACVFLARWQLDRLEQRRAANQVVFAGQQSQALPVDALAERSESPDWRPAVAIGRYDATDELLVRQRSLGGRTGYYVMTPLDSGDLRVWVARGWVPNGPDARTPPPVPAPPTGEVEVVGWARAFERDVPARGLPDGQIQRISAEALPDDGGAVDFWLQASTETPPARQEIPRLPPPEISQGPHLGYAIQWGAFAVMALIGGVVILRRQRQFFAEDLAAEAGLPHPAGPPFKEQ